jgi:hypothetical protein
MVMFYVVKPLDVDVGPKAFPTPKTANDYVNNKGDHGADVCEVYRIEAASAGEAIAKMKAGQGERHVMHRRLSNQEIEERERRDAIAFLRELGL